MIEDTKEERSGSLDEENLHPYLVPESDIRAYVERLGIFDLSNVAARFQIVSDLTSGAYEERKDRLAPSDLRLIKLIADKDHGDQYRRIMRAILIGVGQGRRGINAAHLTASLAVEMTFRWSPEYFSALEGYRDKLRRQRLSLRDQPSSHTTSRRPIITDQ